MKRARETGMALILTLIMVALLSVMAVSLTFLAQAETWSTMNYRLTSQARDGAEAGLNVGANFLLYKYTPPGTASDPLAAYTLTASPVTYNGNPVVLSANSNVSSNYPVAAVQAAFNANGIGYCSSCGLTAGTATVNYQTSATLLSMQSVTLYGGGSATIQTWLITSDGIVNNGVRNAQVELSAILEQQGSGAVAAVPAFQYAALASSNGCDALGFSGSSETDSYNSSTYNPANGAVSATNGGLETSGGNVATNGNLTESGSVTINGTLSTPRALDPNGTVNCQSNNIVAWTTSGSATVTGGLIELPAPVVPPVPAVPSPAPPTTNQSISGSCPTGSSAITGCTNGSSDTVTLAPGQYGNLNVSGNTIVDLSAGTYNVNSINVSGNSQLVITSGPVILNVDGSGQNNPINLSGGTIVNSTLNSLNLQIQYAGTGTVNLSGGTACAGVVDAPKAAINFSGGTNWYGAVIGATLTDSGGTHIHYDRYLASVSSSNPSYASVGNYMLESFTWKKF